MSELTPESTKRTAECVAERESLRKLKAEAVTVHNETGMMPRELVKQRDKLAWLLEQIIADLPTNKDWLNPDIEADARALIERIK